MGPKANLKANGERRAPLTRDRILDAALTLADEVGLEALTMRRLASALGFEAMSLYHYAANKDDIVDGIVDLVVREIELRPRARRLEEGGPGGAPCPRTRSCAAIRGPAIR